VPDDETSDESSDEIADEMSEGGEPAPPRADGGDGATAPGLAVGEGHGALDEAPEPNEPA
jgi:hypothetical protein